MWAEEVPSGSEQRSHPGLFDLLNPHLHLQDLRTYHLN